MSHRKKQTGLKRYHEVISPWGYRLTHDTLRLDYQPTHTYTHTNTHFYAISLTTKKGTKNTAGLKIPYVIHFPHKWSPFIMGPSYFSIQNMHQMLLKPTSVDLLTRLVFDTKETRPLSRRLQWDSQSGCKTSLLQHQQQTTTDWLHHILVDKLFRLVTDVKISPQKETAQPEWHHGAINAY